MAQNFIQEGSFLTLTAPYDLSPGDGALVGLIFGVSVNASLNGAECVLGVEGCWQLDKVGADTFAVGAAVYWDNTAKLCTSTASGNTKIGIAIAAADGTMSTVNVRLNESF